MTHTRERLDRIATATLFDRGNFAEVARRSDETNWRTHASRGVMMVGASPLAHFDAVDAPEAGFLRAVAHWIAGDEDRAAQLLEKESRPEAARLLTLIRKPVIDCLCQLNWHRAGAQDLLRGISRDPKFRVRNISFHEDDLQNAPYADVRRYYDAHRPPDLFLSQMVEWHVIPPNLHELPCPAIGQTSDYDLHIQVLHPLLNCFDALVAEDQLEWLEVGGLAPNTPIETFPKCFGVPADLPKLPTTDRPLDFFVSGSVFHPYWPEKSKLFHDLIMEEALNYRFVQGFLPREAYQYLLGSAKTSVSVIRHPGAMPTRALESLAMGSAVLVQAESALTLFADESHGVFTFDHLQAGDLNRCMRRVLREWRDIAPRVRNGATLVRDQFALPELASQYFRFVTYLGCKCAAKKPAPTRPVVQKRMTLHTGFYPERESDRTAIRNATLARLKSLPLDEPYPFNIIDMTREILLYLASGAMVKSEDGEVHETALLKTLLSFFEFGIKKWPRSLVLQLNLLRCHYHFGDKDAARGLADRILSTPRETWRVHPLEDVLPMDFFNTYFNYRDYFEQVTRQLAFGEANGPRLIDMILAAVHYYLGLCSDAPEAFRSAHELDNSFPYFALSHADALIAAGTPEALTEARALLSTLSNGSVVFKEAFSKLESLQIERADQRRAFRKIQDRHLLLKAKTSDIHLMEETFNENIKQFYQFNNIYELSCTVPETPGVPLVSATLALDEISVTQAMNVLDDLCSQTVKFHLEVFFLHREHEAASAIYQSLTNRIDVVHFVDPRQFEDKGAAVEACIERSEGEFVTVMTPGQSVTKRAFEILVGALQKNDDAVLSYGDYLLHENKTPEFDAASVPIELVRRPVFSKRTLFSLTSLPALSVWRRSFHHDHGYFRIDTFDTFWIKLGLKHDFIHVSKSLGSYNTVVGDSDLWQSANRKRRWSQVLSKHWPKGWGEMPAISPPKPLSHSLMGPSVVNETQWLFSLNFIDRKTAHQAIWYVTIAKELIANGDPLMAEIFLNCIIRMDWSVLTPRFILAELKKQLGEAEQCEALLTDAAHANPIQEMSYIRLGVAKAARGDIGEAIAIMRKACEKTPPSFLATWNLAALLFAAEEYTTAVPLLEEITKTEPLNAEAWGMLALSYDKTGKTDAARLAMLQAERQQSTKGSENGIIS